MALTDFATPEQMEQRSQGAITAASHPFLEEELAAATRAIRDACGWHVAGLEQVRVRRRTPHAQRIWLPAMHIASIGEATINGHAATGIDFDPDTGWTDRVGTAWDITFTAGLEEVPATLVTLTLHIAARALGSPLGVTREQAGAVSVGHTLVAPGAAGGTTILPHELATIAPYRLGGLP